MYNNAVTPDETPRRVDCLLENRDDDHDDHEFRDAVSRYLSLFEHEQAGEKQPKHGGRHQEAGIRGLPSDELEQQPPAPEREER